MASTKDLLKSIQGRHFVNAKKQFSSIVKEKMREALAKEYLDTASGFMKEDVDASAPPAAPAAPAAPRPLSVIARDIRKNWPNVNYAAKPYLDAMSELTDITDNYYEDSAESVVLYFLGNATTWRGPEAKRIKDELKSMLKKKSGGNRSSFYEDKDAETKDDEKTTEKMRKSDVLASIRKMGMQAKWDFDWEEFIIDYKKNDPRRSAESSYHTDDADDALSTAKQMSKWSVNDVKKHRMDEAAKPEPSPEEKEKMLQSIRRGDKVTIAYPLRGSDTVPQTKTGTAVMPSSHGGWVLNMGGAHGTPAVVDDNNIVSVRKARV